jgi:hypothetical protein
MIDSDPKKPDHTQFDGEDLVVFDLSRKTVGPFGMIAGGISVILLVVFTLIPVQIDIKMVLLSAPFIVLFVVLMTAIYSWMNRGKVIRIEYEKQSVVMYGFRYPLSFFDMNRKKCVTLPFDSILSVHLQPAGWWGLRMVVYTIDSKFSHTDIEDNFEELASRLLIIARDGGRVPLVRGGLVLGIVSGIVGLLSVVLIGWILGWI